MPKLTGQTPDLAQENIERLKTIFPDVFEEGKIDFEKLKQDLGEYVDDEKERYNFSWNGKGRALRLAQTPSTGTLRPCPGESREWDTTQNLYIEGDNLEVLKLLQKSYHGKVKMIYIDPPYNTGGDFVYPDDFSDGIANYKRITRQVDSEGNSISTNTEASGRYHTDWLNMMYPRLRLARNLLRDDGVIFISIDDNEVENLKKVCNEIYSEDNFIAAFKWNRVAKAPSLSGMVRTKYEYVIAYFKSKAPSLFGKESYNKQAPLWHLPNKRSQLLFPAKSIRINTTYPAGDYGGSYQVTLLDDIDMENGLNSSPVRVLACSAWSQKKIDDYIADGNTFQIKKNPQTFYTDLDSENNYIAPSDLINNEECGVKRNTDANEDLKQMGIPFDYSKPVSLLQYLLKMVMYEDNDSLLVDFFSGSATAAHATIQLNAEDSGNRKFIMVQLPEPCAEGTEALKAGYNNICEIGKERIRRAGDKIKTEIEEQSAQMKIGEEPKQVPDIGFKVFKLDSSNLKKWNGEVAYRQGENEQLKFDAEKLREYLSNSVDNYMPGRTELDVVYEIMLKLGLDLTYPVEQRQIAGKNVYSIGFGALMMCMDDDITVDVATGMAALHKELIADSHQNKAEKEEDKLWKVVFKDNGFKDDSVKTNVMEILKAAGLKAEAFTTV